MNRWIGAICLLLGTYSVYASGIQVSEVQVNLDPKIRKGTIIFSVAWEYSWKISTRRPKNHDAAWVFAKYRVKPSGEWHHVYLSDKIAGYSCPPDALLEVGLSNLSTGGNGTQCNTGVFISRSKDGADPVDFRNVVLDWDLVKNNLTGSENIEICVFAIEMVYVPQGSFYLGDGQSTGSFIHKSTLQPYKIDGPDRPINFHNQELTTLNHNVGDKNTNSLPTDWPNGYKAFYCMKYEITQGEYAAFLSKIPVSARNNYWQSNSQNRYGIKRNGDNSPVFLADDATARVACNYLGTEDIRAWLVWAGLRPMSEFEYEKACRGPGIPVVGEFAWGNTVCNPLRNIDHRGTALESPRLPDSNCNVESDDPVRVGAFSTANSSRTKSGGGYYGVMELSGNVYERCVTFGLDEGRKFRGRHGNGEIGTGQYSACPVDWPGQPGLGYRGGSFSVSRKYARTSDRDWINFQYVLPNRRQHECGGRGVRTAPGLPDTEY